MAGAPLRSARATVASVSGATVGRAGTGRAAAGPVLSFQAVSAGRISVATWPGEVRAA